MKTICRMALFILLGSAVFAGNIWAQGSRTPTKAETRGQPPQKPKICTFSGRGPIAITANFGGGNLEGETEISLAASKSNKDAKIGLAKLGLGLAYTQPVNPVLGIGGFAEARLLLNNYKLKVSGSASGAVDETGIFGWGFAVGPYFRLSRLGADKKSGLGFSPYFTLNALRPETEDKAGEIKVPTKAILALGGGLRADIFINELFGLNLGFELLGGKVDLNGKDEWKTAVPLFGAVFYGGVTLSF